MEKVLKQNKHERGQGSNTAPSGRYLVTALHSTSIQNNKLPAPETLHVCENAIFSLFNSVRERLAQASSMSRDLGKNFQNYFHSSTPAKSSHIQKIKTT